MQKSFFKIVFSVYFGALFLCSVIQGILKISFTDHETGFYIKGTALPLIFGFIFYTSIIVLVLLNLFKSTFNDYPLHSRSRLSLVLSIATGLSVIFYIWLGLPRHIEYLSIINRLWERSIVYSNLIFGSIVGLSFIIFGFAGLFFPAKAPIAFLMIMPALWQTIVVISRFNGYPSVLYITDNLLSVLFMLFIILFYIGHARTISGYARSDGKNYIISSGLVASLCGITLTVTNLVYYLAAGTIGGITITAATELIYTFFASLYALVYVISYTKKLALV